MTTIYIVHSAFYSGGFFFGHPVSFHTNKEDAIKAHQSTLYMTGIQHTYRTNCEKLVSSYGGNSRYFQEVQRKIMVYMRFEQGGIGVLCHRNFSWDQDDYHDIPDHNKREFRFPKFPDHVYFSYLEGPLARRQQHVYVRLSLVSLPLLRCEMKYLNFLKTTELPIYNERIELNKNHFFTRKYKNMEDLVAIRLQNWWKKTPFYRWRRRINKVHSELELSPLLFRFYH